MTKTIERGFTHKELSTVGIRCFNCRGEIRLNLSERNQWNRFSNAEQADVDCPYCGETLERNAARALWSLHQWYRRLEGEGFEVTFYAREEAEEE